MQLQLTQPIILLNNRPVISILRPQLTLGFHV